jgi:hypothetical protein
MCLTNPNPGDAPAVFLDMAWHGPKTVQELFELMAHRLDLPAEISDEAEKVLQSLKGCEFASLNAYSAASKDMAPEVFNDDHQEPLE